MSVLRYVRLDVFTNQPFTGIQLAVFPDAAGIDERRMQWAERVKPFGFCKVGLSYFPFQRILWARTMNLCGAEPTK
jgi:hypothetical protein